MLLIDNNLSPKLAFKLQSAFPGIKHVYDFGLEDADDLQVWDFALANNYHILTKDQDFVHLVHLRGFPPKVIRLNCGNVSTRIVEKILMQELTIIEDFCSSTTFGLLVIN